MKNAINLNQLFMTEHMNTFSDNIEELEITRKQQLTRDELYQELKQFKIIGGNNNE